MEGVVHLEDELAVEVPNKVGQLEKITKKIAKAGIDTLFVYGSPGDGKAGILVLKTANDREAMRLLNRSK
jgi:hypothetical protein